MGKHCTQCTICNAIYATGKHWKTGILTITLITASVCSYNNYIHDLYSSNHEIIVKQKKIYVKKFKRESTISDRPTVYGLQVNTLKKLYAKSVMYECTIIMLPIQYWMLKYLYPQSSVSIYWEILSIFYSDVVHAWDHVNIFVQRFYSKMKPRKMELMEVG